MGFDLNELEDAYNKTPDFFKISIYCFSTTRADRGLSLRQFIIELTKQDS
jgi:hypothetical protein